MDERTTRSDPALEQGANQGSNLPVQRILEAADPAPQVLQAVAADQPNREVFGNAWSPVSDYCGKDVDDTDSGDLATFLAFIEDVAAPPTKLLRFGLADGLESSGVLELLDINFGNPGAGKLSPLVVGVLMLIVWQNLRGPSPISSDPRG